MTALLSAYHATHPKCRDSIHRYGLLPNEPTRERPYGVYVFRADRSLDHATYNSNVYWSAGPDQDVWQVGYFGPVLIDEFVFNGIVLLDEPQLVELVTDPEPLPEPTDT